MEAGLDSLGAIELRNAVAATFHVSLPVTAAFDYPTIQTLAQQISKLVTVPTSVAANPNVSKHELRTAIQQETGVNLPATFAFDHPNIASMAVFLAAEAHFPSLRLFQSLAERPPVPQQQDLLPKLQGMVQDILGSSVAANQPLMEAGLDSLAAIELRNAIASHFSITLPATAVFDHPTLAALASLISGMLAASARQSPDASQPVISQPLLDVQDYLGPHQVVEVLQASCMYSGCNPDGGHAAFWSTIAHGTNIQQVVPLERWDIDAFYNPEGPAGSQYMRFGAFIQAPGLHDVAVSKLSRNEAIATDPQARLLIEASGEVLLSQNGGSGALPRWQGTCGTYVGCMFVDYMSLLRNGYGFASTGPVMTGNGAPYQCGRVAYTFGLQGPCQGIDTACSSSLVAAHNAFRGILGQEETHALAAGINLMLWHDVTSGICQLQALSRVGRCQTFEAAADGYGRGEGIAVLLLGSVDVRQDTDQGSTMAILRGSAVNQDGRSSSLTAPNGPSQKALVGIALEYAESSKEEVGYVAIHGTGTPLGDPIEVGALAGALANSQSPLCLGSVKACYGHTEGAAVQTSAAQPLPLAKSHFWAGPFQHILVHPATQQHALQFRFNAQISSASLAFLRDHQVLGRALLPGSAFLEAAWAAGAVLTNDAVSSHMLSVLQSVSIEATFALPSSQTAQQPAHVSSRSTSRPPQQLTVVINTATWTSDAARGDDYPAVHMVRCDAASKEESTAGLRSQGLWTDAPAVDSVFHAGGVLQDAMLGQQSFKGLREIFAPKLDALSAITAQGAAAGVQTMVLFSSIASLLGSPGQGNYAAANAAMDAAADHTQSQGNQMGYGAVAPSAGLLLLQGILGHLARPQDAGITVIAASPFQWDAFLSGIAASVLEADVEPTQPLMEAGLDSLAAVELRNAIASAFSITLPATLAFDFPTTAAIAQHIVDNAASADIAAEATTQEASADDLFDEEALDHYTINGNAVMRGESGSIVTNLLRTTTQNLQSIVADIAGQLVEDDQPMAEAGLDSLGSVELRSQVSERFGIALPVTLAYDYPTVQALAGFITPQLAAVSSLGRTSSATTLKPQRSLARALTRPQTASIVVQGVASQFPNAEIGGPCISTDTACSSSLVAAHLASKGIKDGETDTAVAGGVNVMLSPKTAVKICRLQALSPAGRCKTFDVSADGYGRGEGVGLMLLSSDSGQQSQQHLAVIQSAGLVPGSITCLAVHGTGTPLGDPIETGAIGRALGSKARPGTDHVQRLALTSVKSCYGHTEGAAGIAGAQMALATLSSRARAPILNLRSVNSYVAGSWEEWVQERALMPATAFFELAQSACQALVEPGLSRSLTLGDLSILAPCFLADLALELLQAIAQNSREVSGVTASLARAILTGSQLIAQCSSAAEDIVRGLMRVAALELPAVKWDVVDMAANTITKPPNAVGLNFRDVLNCLGMYPGDPGNPGADCAGIVQAVGSAVRNLHKVGDYVYGQAEGCLGTSVIGSAHTMVPCPAVLGPVEASTIPTVFMTAWTCLREAPHLKPGQSILIHAATGGLGLAAVQVAMASGCLPLGTAGSSQKRSHLRSMGAAVALSSRSTEFPDQLIATGKPAPVMVLNSLTSPGMVAASLASVAAGGQFVEVGKRDIWSPARISQERPDLHSHLVAIDFWPSKTVGDHMRQLSILFRQGNLKPLPPLTHPLSNSAAALRQLSAARHVGKVVVQHPSGSNAGSLAHVGRKGRWVVTGGLGALGSLSGRWLAQRGMQHLCLLGRTGHMPLQQGPILTAMTGGDWNAAVTVRLADSACAEEMASVLGSHRELGLDSLGAVELRNEIGRAVGSELPGTLVYDYPTISSIVAFLLPKMMPAAQGPDFSLQVSQSLRSVPLLLAEQASLDTMVEVEAVVAQTATKPQDLAPAGDAMKDTWDILEADTGLQQTAVAVGIARLSDPPAVTGRKAGGGFTGTGRALSVTAGRLSYTHGLRGPCVSIDTACSSSLDGRSSSLTAPNGPSQQQVIRTAFSHGGMQPSDAALLEMHGTGTALGDPIEIGAALAVLGPHVPGVSIQRQHAPMQLLPEEGSGSGISAFAFQGTNAHIVLAPSSVKTLTSIGSEPGTSRQAAIWQHGRTADYDYYQWRCDLPSAGYHGQMPILFQKPRKCWSQLLSPNVLHAGGVLADGLISKQTPAKLRAVLAPKVNGALNLHHQAACLPLAGLVLFSSVATLLGNAGQSNYAAANGCLDAFATNLTAQAPPAELHQQEPTVTLHHAHQGLSIAEVTATLTSTVEGVIGTAIEPNTPMMSAGLDSLAAVELRNMVQQRYSVALSATAAFDYPSIQVLAEHIAGQVKPVRAPTSATRQRQRPGMRNVNPGPTDVKDHAEVLAELAFIIRSVLGADIAPDQPLMQAGLDSLGAVELRSAMSQAFNGGVQHISQPIPASPTSSIVSLACRYPAASLEAAGNVTGQQGFWGNLARGQNLQTPVPLSRWDVDGWSLHQHGHSMFLILGSPAFGQSGGVNIMLEPRTTARICLLQALSPVGRCKTFDATGDGYGRGEGFAVAVLRSLQEDATTEDAPTAIVRGCPEDTPGGASASHTQLQQGLLWPYRGYSRNHRGPIGFNKPAAADPHTDP
ncbi:hypothetical protein WJX84_006132 [Apatococcus fuscideae]|uniref:Uncharacterized protein n=1 Tax=Apatococcus fuscideae TaxID=2026836 RepID=A0AAW1T6Y9_9CHLO